MLLVIDNYDSFTFNLVHYLMELGASVEVVRNDALTAAQANGQTIAGTGTTSVFGNIAANANFTLIASLEIASLAAGTGVGT